MGLQPARMRHPSASHNPTGTREQTPVVLPPKTRGNVSLSPGLLHPMGCGWMPSRSPFFLSPHGRCVMGDSGYAQQSHPEFQLSGYTPLLIGTSPPMWIPRNCPSEAAGQNPVGDGKREAERALTVASGLPPASQPRVVAGRCPPSHLPTAGLQQHPGAEQTPELPQQRHEDVQDVGPSAHGEEEDEEAPHPHQHGPEHQPLARALPGLLCDIGDGIGEPPWGHCDLRTPTMRTPSTGWLHV